MGEWFRFRTSPLFRLTETYEDDLNRIRSPQLESQLAEQLRERLSEATVKRDQVVKSLFIIDALLAVALSGQNFVIPAIGLSTSAFPALLEILVGLASFAVCIAAMSFTTWLCYSQLLWAVIRRTAKSADLHGGILVDSDHFNEMGIRLFQRQIAIGGQELFKPLGGFKALILVYEILTKVLFGLVPIMHLLLVGYGIVAIVERSGFTLLHSLLYISVAAGHLLAVIFWFAPNKEFAFLMRPEGSGG